MKLVFLMGQQGDDSGWSVTQVGQKPAIYRGLLHFETDNSVQWNLPKTQNADKYIISVKLRCRWIGQIFFSAGAGETYLLYADAREFVPGKPFTLDFLFKQGKMIMSFAGSDKPLGNQVDAPMPPEHFTIRSNQSDFLVESIEFLDKDSGQRIAFDDFGPDFKPLTVVGSGVLIALLFFAACWADGWLFHRIFGREPAALASSFTTAVLPVAFAFLLLDKVAFENLLDDLMFCCLVYRLAMAYGLDRRISSEEKNIGRNIIYLGFLAGGIGFATYFFYSINLIKTPIQVGSTVAVISLTAICLILILRAIGQEKEFDWFGHAAFLWLFPALGNVVIYYVDDEDAIAPISWFIAFTSVVAAFRIFALLRNRVRYYQVFALGFALLSIVCLEGALRASPYETRFRPMNIGKVFAEDELLFWVPKTLFEDEVSHQPVDDFEVRKVKFRSGSVSRQKAPGVFRIMVLGGSNTWGQWIDDETLVWPTRMERRLSELLPDIKFEVINAGVRAYNLFQLLVLYEHFLSDYELDMIVLYVNINDRSAHNRKGMYTYRELYELRTQGKLKQVIENRGSAKNSSKPTWVATVQKKLQVFTLYNALTKAMLGFRSSRIGQKFDPGLSKSLNPVEDYKENLDAFIKIGEKKNIRIVIGDEFTYFGDDVENRHDVFQEAMKQVAKEHNAPFFPAHDILAENYTRSAIVFPWDTVHLNEKGHKALGDEFAQFLADKALLVIE